MISSGATPTRFIYRAIDFPEIRGGLGALSMLGELLTARAVERVLIVTSNSFVREALVLRTVISELQGRLADVFSETQPHSPKAVVDAALGRLVSCRAQAIVSLGGGSAVDTAKGVIWYFDENRSLPPIVHVAIPSTFSGAEYTTDAGISMDGTKKVHRHSRIIPSAVILDPRVPATTPMALRRNSLANALAHCLEGSVSIQASPMTDAFYLHAIHLTSMAAGDLATLDGLIAGQSVAALAALHQIPMGLAHALAHVIGGRYKTPHGATHGVLGPAVMRLNLPIVASAQADIGRALGLSAQGTIAQQAWAAVKGIRDLYDRLDVPPGLKDLGIERRDLSAIAELVIQDASYKTNPLKLEGADGRHAVLQCLEWAWSGEIPPP